MASVSDFHKVVVEYLAGSVDRKVFTKRFAELFYNIEKSGDLAAIELSYAIEAYLAEAISGLVTEGDLRDALSRCVSGASVKVQISEGFRADSAFRVEKEDTSSLLYRPAEVAYA